MWLRIFLEHGWPIKWRPAAERTVNSTIIIIIIFGNACDEVRLTKKADKRG